MRHKTGAMLAAEILIQHMQQASGCLGLVDRPVLWRWNHATESYHLGSKTDLSSENHAQRKSHNPRCRCDPPSCHLSFDFSFLLLLLHFFLSLLVMHHRLLSRDGNKAARGDVHAHRVQQGAGSLHLGPARVAGSHGTPDQRLAENAAQALVAGTKCVIHIRRFL